MTALPRGRTAWLAALLTAHGAPCLHEPSIAYGHPVTLNEMFADGFLGLSDPGATIVYRETLKEAFDGCPAVLVRRDSSEARAAFETWLGRPADGWGKAEDGIKWFSAEFDPLVVEFDDLDDPEVVHGIVRHVANRDLDDRIFKLFDTLKVEQHSRKATARMKPIPWLS